MEDGVLAASTRTTILVPSHYCLTFEVRVSPNKITACSTTCYCMKIVVLRLEVHFIWFAGIKVTNNTNGSAWRTDTYMHHTASVKRLKINMNIKFYKYFVPFFVYLFSCMNSGVIKHCPTMSAVTDIPYWNFIYCQPLIPPIYGYVN